MTTLTFDSIHRSPPRVRRPAARRPQAVPLAPAAVPVAPPVKPRRRVGTLALVGSIAALHVAAIVSLSGGTHTRPLHVPPQPISIALVAPKVEPPPPPKPQVQPPRAKAVTPVAHAQAAPQPAPSTPVVASAPQAPASAETVQVAQAAPVAPAAPVPAVVEKVTEPRGYAGYLHNPAPAYPTAAQKRGLEGQVVLKVHVLPTGQPDSVTVAHSSGHAILDEAALKAVMQWAFEPARRGQTPIDGWVQVPLSFKI